MATSGEARAFAHALLGAIYRAAGGDGRNLVRVDVYQAARYCTGDHRPSRADEKYVREVLHALARMTDLQGWRVQTIQEGARDRPHDFTIQPRERPGRPVDAGASS